MEHVKKYVAFKQFHLCKVVFFKDYQEHVQLEPQKTVTGIDVKLSNDLKAWLSLTLNNSPGSDFNSKVYDEIPGGSYTFPLHRRKKAIYLFTYLSVNQ